MARSGVIGAKGISSDNTCFYSELIDIKGGNFIFKCNVVPSDNYMRIGFYNDNDEFVVRSLITVNNTNEIVVENTGNYPKMRISAKKNCVNDVIVKVNNLSAIDLNYRHFLKNEGSKVDYVGVNNVDVTIPFNDNSTHIFEYDCGALVYASSTTSFAILKIDAEGNSTDIVRLHGNVEAQKDSIIIDSDAVSVRFVAHSNELVNVSLATYDFDSLIGIRKSVQTLFDENEHPFIDYSNIIFKNDNTYNLPYLMGHRGMKNLAPENSIPSFVLAGKSKLLACETDAQITSDGVVVCMHDSTIDRTTNGVGNVSDYTYEQLLQYYIDINPQGSYTEDELRIPKLEDYLKVCKAYGMMCQIELKSDIFDEVIAVLDAYNMRSHTMLSSSSLGRIRNIRKKYKDIFVHYIASATTLSPVDSVKPYYPCSISFDFTSPEEVPGNLMTYCNSRKVKYCFRAADTVEDVLWHIDKGACMIPTNVIKLSDVIS